MTVTTATEHTMTAATVHILPHTPKQNTWGTNKAEDVIFEGRRFFVGYIDRDEEGRQVHQGPMVPGPWAYAGACSIVISDFHIEPEPATEVQAGDIVIIKDTAYRIRDRRVKETRQPGDRLCNDDWLALDVIE